MREISKPPESSMNSISFNLSEKIEKPLVDALYTLKKVADSLNIHFFVVGASARDLILKHCYGIEPLRKTGDIDLGVEVASWEQFGELTESLTATGQFFPTLEKQRFRHGIILIDILPFGSITDQDKEIRWPPEHEIIMSMAGFEEAYEYSITVRLSSDPVLDIKVSTLPGLAIMKLISWKDKYPERKRDAGDLLLIMNKYEEAGNSERLYVEEISLLQDENFDARMASIRLLGRDMAKISDTQTLQIVKSILDAEIENLSQYKLVSDMMRESGILEARFDEILFRLEKLWQGIIEVGEKNLMPLP
jgi:predicted nucleotidyltransferase